jgi:outer membrane protein
MKTSIAIMLFLIFTSPVFAQQADVAETYTDTGIPAPEEGMGQPSGFHGVLGAGFFTAKRIFGDNHLLINVGPVILMRYEDIAYWSLIGGGVWLAQTADHSLRFGAGARTHAGWVPGIDPYRAGMADRKGSVDGYLNAVWKTSLATFGVHYYHDILDGNLGDTASIRISKKVDMGNDLWLIPSIGAEWQSGARVDYYYGVRPEEALPSRPVYTGTSTLNANLGVAGHYRLSDSWSLLGGLFETRYGNGIVDSPIVTRRYQTLMFFGAGWMF